MDKIYENDSYCREQVTRVMACVREGDRYAVQLENTIFFPEEGGQYADTGELTVVRGEKTVPEGSSEGGNDCSSENQGIRVLDGKIQKGEIWYLVDREIPVGAEVSCRLDWEQRFSRMQQHTGEHILTGTIHNRYGYNNVGFHLSDEGPVTLDLDGPLTYDQAMEMEEAANAVVFANVPVTALYPSREELKDITYRSKIEIEGQVRLIRIGSAEETVDLCACCAPHVARTGEVGLIKIVSVQNYKGGVRLGILCGGRALSHYRTEWHRSLELAKSLSTGVEQVADSVAALREELTESKQKLAALQEKMILQEIAEIPSEAPHIWFSEENLAPAVLKNCFNAMTEKFPDYVGIFMGNDTDGYRYSAGSATLDSRSLAAKMREDLSAKGGGSKEMIQGKVSSSKEELIRFWKTL